MKLNTNNKIKYAVPYILTLATVAVMMTAAQIFNEKEIIFPEITALAIGYMTAPKRSWKVNGKRMITLITLCAVAGVLIVRYISLTDYMKIIIAFVISQILFMFSGTTFAPLISAIVLPVMMHTTSFIYPVSAFLLTAVIIFFNKLLIKYRIRENEEYVPAMLNSRNDIIDTVLRVICIIFMAYAAIALDFRFAVSPPLLVAFTEFSRPCNKARLKPVKTVLLITGCAFAGSFSRYILNIKCGLPLAIAALTAVLIMLIAVNRTEMYMPPAGAITVLSMIIPKTYVIIYPVQIFTGSVVIMIFSRFLFMKRQDK